MSRVHRFYYEKHKLRRVGYRSDEVEYHSWIFYLDLKQTFKTHWGSSNHQFYRKVIEIVCVL